MAKQGIAFRGDKDAGYFKAVLDLLSNYSTAVKISLDKKKGAVKMTSRKVQNELLTFIGEDFLLKDIIEEKSSQSTIPSLLMKVLHTTSS